jgi:hypothetical protein
MQGGLGEPWNKGGVLLLDLAIFTFRVYNVRLILLEVSKATK